MDTKTDQRPRTPSGAAGCSLARLLAVAAKCRNRGGDCDCRHGCKAVTLGSERLCGLRADRERLDQEISSAERVMTRVQTPPATLRSGFTFREGLTPVMVFEGNEAQFGYENQHGDWIECNEWPFNESFVWYDDCERFGIRVE